jgi:DNA primase small subunit
MTAALEDIVLQYTYPRLDAEVSKHRNHLLKAPFCVHPKTGRVCVPVDPQRVDEFDPTRVPTVQQLLQELDREASRGNAMQTDIPITNADKGDWEKTSLKPYVQMLEQIGSQLKRDFMSAKSGGL